jgi:hypothetical protein
MEAGLVLQLHVLSGTISKRHISTVVRFNHRGLPGQLSRLHRQIGGKDKMDKVDVLQRSA